MDLKTLNKTNASQISRTSKRDLNVASKVFAALIILVLLSSFFVVVNAGAIVQQIINPAVEEVLKAAMAKHKAEEIVTRRNEVNAEVDDLLTERLAAYHIAVDDISLVHVRFSNRFRDAVEAKQIAEQEAKRAEFVALKAKQEAEAQLNLAKGEAEAQRLLRENLTPEMLQRQAVSQCNPSHRCRDQSQAKLKESL